MKTATFMIVSGLILSTTLAGCERWMQVAERPSRGAGAVGPSIASDHKSPAVLGTIRIIQNGAQQNPNIEFERRVVGILQDTHLFSHTVLTGYAEPPAGGHVEARLTVEERVDPHPGQAAWKGVVIGASMFTLTSLFPLEYDYSSRMTLEVRRWDGQLRRYTADSNGTAFYHLFAATPLTATELKGKVTEVGLADLRDQLVQDAAFYTVHDLAALRRPAATTTAAIDSAPVSESGDTRP